MKTFLLALSAMLALPVFAQDSLQRDTVHEVHAQAVTLPVRAGDDIVIKACDTCVTRNYAADATRYQIGESQVGLVGMKEFFKQYPTALLAVELSQDGRSVVLIYAAPTQR